MPILHIIEGPVGAGKTTYAHKLAQKCGTPALVLDQWMTNLFQPDRPETDIWAWYGVRKARLIRQIMHLAYETLECGNDAIVEIGLIKTADRLNLYADLEAAGRDYLVHVLETPREIRKQRVMNRNAEQGRTYAMQVSDDVFEMASDMWEPVGGPEQNNRPGRFRFIAP